MRDDPGPFSIQARYITISPLAAVSETTLQENTIVKKKTAGRYSHAATITRACGGSVTSDPPCHALGLLFLTAALL